MCPYTINRAHTIQGRGRNFGLKSEVPILTENEAPLDPGAKGEENGEEVSPPHPTLGSGRAS